jgi:hypothetical protein
LPTKFFLAFREDVESSMQDPTNKEGVELQNAIKNTEGRKFTEATRIDWNAEGVV